MLSGVTHTKVTTLIMNPTGRHKVDVYSVGNHIKWLIDSVSREISVKHITFLWGLSHICFLTFSGLALPHQEGSSSVLQVQKEPLRVAPSDLPKIPPAKVGHRESVLGRHRASSADRHKLSDGWKNGILLACTLENLFSHLYADVQ